VVFLFGYEGARMSDSGERNPDRLCQKLLGEGGPSEVRDWLRKGRKNTLGVLQSNGESRKFAEQMYVAGAQKVFAVKIDKYHGGMENTGKLVVERPIAPFQRQKILSWGSAVVEEQGFDAFKELGQQYIFVSLE